MHLASVLAGGAGYRHGPALSENHGPLPRRGGQIQAAGAQGASCLPFNAGGIGKAAPAARANRQACACERRRAGRGCRSLPPAHGGPGKWKISQTIRCNRREIGRASGREKVRRFVILRVVPVSLKKKKHKQSVKL